MAGGQIQSDLVWNPDVLGTVLENSTGLRGFWLPRLPRFTLIPGSGYQTGPRDPKRIGGVRCFKEFYASIFGSMVSGWFFRRIRCQVWGGILLSPGPVCFPAIFSTSQNQRGEGLPKEPTDGWMTWGWSAVGDLLNYDKAVNPRFFVFTAHSKQQYFFDNPYRAGVEIWTNRPRSELEDGFQILGKGPNLWMCQIHTVYLTAW